MIKPTPDLLKRFDEEMMRMNGLCWEIDSLLSKGHKNECYRKGHRWSYAKETKGSTRKNYSMTPNSHQLLNNLQRKSGFGSSDLVNDAVRLYYALTMDLTGTQLEEYSNRFKLKTMAPIAQSREARYRDRDHGVMS